MGLGWRWWMGRKVRKGISFLSFTNAHVSEGRKLSEGFSFGFMEKLKCFVCKYRFLFLQKSRNKIFLSKKKEKTAKKTKSRCSENGRKLKICLLFAFNISALFLRSRWCITNRNEAKLNHFLHLFSAKFYDPAEIEASWPRSSKSPRSDYWRPGWVVKARIPYHRVL